MNTNEIKKALYKEKPIAIKIAIDGYEQHYTAKTSLGEVLFRVPVSDMGDRLFEDKIPAQLLIRWISK